MSFFLKKIGFILKVDIEI